LGEQAIVHPAALSATATASTVAAVAADEVPAVHAVATLVAPV